MAFSPDGLRLAAGVSGDVGVAVATIWDVGVTASAEVGNVPSTVGAWRDVAFTPDGRYLLTSQAGGAVGVWDATTLEPVRTLGTRDFTRPEFRGVPIGAPEDYWVLKPSPDGELVAALPEQASYGTGPGAGRVTVWDVESGKERFTAGEGWRASDMAWSPDGDLLAIAGGTDHYPYDRAPENGRDFVTIYDRQGELVTTIDALPAEFLYSIRFTADGESLILVILAYGGFDPQVSRVEVRDWRTGDVEYTLPADAVLAIPDPTGRVIVTTPDLSADDQATTVWDTGSRREIARLESTTARHRSDLRSHRRPDRHGELGRHRTSLGRPVGRGAAHLARPHRRGDLSVLRRHRHPTRLSRTRRRRARLDARPGPARRDRRGQADPVLHRGRVPAVPPPRLVFGRPLKRCN